MRQVPHYLIIGNGRVSRHFQYYFSRLNLPYTLWHRRLPHAQLHHALTLATHVLLLVNDSAIDSFIAEHLREAASRLIHFSGSLVTENAYGAHPLMTFSEALYDLEHYQAIPFVLDHDAPEFENLLPGLPNQHVRLHKTLKPKYHALCVMSGNFSCILWQKLFKTLEQEFSIPASVAYPYLYQQTQNLLLNPDTALTGPLVRGDDATIEKNLAALEDDVFRNVYESFAAAYKKTEEIKHEHI